MNDCTEDIILHNGVRMPRIGLGTTHSGGYVHETVVYALRDCGYRLIDTARRYGTEFFIACAIEDAHVERDSLFLTTKLWPSDYSFSSAIEAASMSMKRLNTDYLDLYLLHWPTSSILYKKETLEETWRALELLLDNDKCRSIGVSNFNQKELEELMDIASIIPHVNQHEFHPYQNPQKLRQFCKENSIQFQGHSPLGKGRLLNEDLIKEIAVHYNKTPAQILIRWSIQNNVVTIPKSIKKERVIENMQSTNFLLEDETMAFLDTLHKDLRVVELDRINKSLSSNQPDGYKIEQSVHSHLPTKLWNN